MRITLIRWKTLSVPALLAAFTLLLGSCVFFTPSYAPDDLALSRAEELEAAGLLSFQEPVYRLDPPGNEIRAGLIFYPGAKVDVRAYIPLFERISREGYRVYIVQMPLDFAFLNSNAARDIIEAERSMERWVLSGHSLGGAMAWEHLKNNQDQFSGMIFIGSYPAASSDLSHLDLAVLSIREEFGLPGSNEKADEVRSNLPEDTLHILIRGANHAGYGNYGPQKDDGEATISKELQQDLTAEYILDFLENRVP